MGCTNVTDVYCYADPAKLEWEDGKCNDFKADKATVCHVATDKLSEFIAKWSTGNTGTDINVTFGLFEVGDANDNDIVDVADIVEMVNAKNGNPSNKFVLKNADLDGDGKITQADIDKAVELILHKNAK